MASPFPGMDPYLEGSVWPDVHQRLATEISIRLTPQLRPHYFARLAVKTIQDPTPETEIGILYPDVEILRQKTGRDQLSTPALAGGVVIAEGAPISPALAVPLLDFEVRIVTIEIYDREKHQLITGIEILSPVNKREPGLTKYRQKRDRLAAAGVHLLEIDLLRRGQRPMITARVYNMPNLADAPYLITLTRAGATRMEAWPLRLQDKLPVVAVPLRTPDPDVPLDLGAVLSTIYEQAGYDLSIDYRQTPPPPPFDEKTQEWMKQWLADYQ
jgi:hypothetical protein